jgi:hypothetical protein
MISIRGFKTFGGAGAAALSLSALLGLSACEERPYPTAAKNYEQPKGPPPLAGAPAYAPPAQPSTPPPQAYAPPPAPTYAPPAPRPYDNPAIVAMAPIPNPGEYGSDGYYHRGRGHGYGSRPAPSYGEAPPPPPKRYHNPPPPPTYAANPPPVKVYKPAPPAPTYAAKPPPVKVYKPAPPAPTYAAKPPVVKPDYKKPEPPKPTYAKATAPKVAPENTNQAHAAMDKTKVAVAAAGVAAGVAAKDIGHAAMAATDKAKDKAKDAVAATKAAVPAPPAAKPAAAPTTNTTDRSTRLAALQSALTDAVSKGAVLTTPPRFTANTPADVTLTVPAGFYDTLHKEAEKNGLTDSAASVNMTAVLSGEGFSVTPDETQSVPLTVNQPTEFRWTVTAQPGAKGPLHADVGADLLGGGSDTLALGSVQKAGGFGPKLTPAIIGWAILVLVAALVVAWLARGRGPTRSASARRASRQARGARPLDMDTGAAH